VTDNEDTGGCRSRGGSGARHRWNFGGDGEQVRNPRGRTVRTVREWEAGDYMLDFGLAKVDRVEFLTCVRWWIELAHTHFASQIMKGSFLRFRVPRKLI